MVYVTGDMHGDEERLYSKEMKKLKEGDTLIVAGDFGFIWNGGRNERRILKMLGKRKFNICFIDGPHDNLDKVYSYRETVWKGGLVHRVSGNLFHLCRGQIFNIEDKRIFTFGGGESSDKEIRNDNQKWFKTELPTPDQMQQGVENLTIADMKVDYIITHEPPSMVKSAMLLRSGQNDYVNLLNGFLQEINNNVEFKCWYFGSLHEDRVITPRHTAVFKRVTELGEPTVPQYL